MDKQDNTNTITQTQLLAEYYGQLERQGPGSSEMTRKALQYIGDIDSEAQIADLGCGTGGQTMTLAQQLQGNIRGIDSFPEFIEKLNSNARELGVQNRVKGMVGSMENLPFDDRELDLIWSEGAIYNIGFERGLKLWHRFLKSGGYIAVTELSWLTDDRPIEIETYWKNAYAEVDTIANKRTQMELAGYRPITTFTLPEDCWTTHYYEPQIRAQQHILAKYKGNAMAEVFVESERKERELYDRFKAYYGYVFYIGVKAS